MRSNTRMLKIGLCCLVGVGVVSAIVASRAMSESVPSTDGTPEAVPVDDEPFVVHEWGTFTSFSGSDGVKLEFRPLVDNDLPPFVLDQAKQSGIPGIFSKSSVRVIQRMETPVTYFYTDRERDVDVRVGFPKGLLTEFYPPVESMKPVAAPPTLPALELVQPKVEDSELDWGTVHLIPTDHLATHVDSDELKTRVEHHLLASLLPGTRPLVDTTVLGWQPPFTDTPNHYYHARETDSAIVHVRRERKAPQLLGPTGDFFEKFLFYRGVGNFDLPLKLVAEGDDRFVLTNEGATPIGGLFLVTVEDDVLRYRRFDEVPAKGTSVLENSEKARTIEALAKDVTAVLVEQGLYEKEAKAMVATWRESWFGERGTRLFYVVPTDLTEELLPLDVSPQPDETVRILVGRMEIMTPESEQRVIAAIRASAERRNRMHARLQELQAEPAPGQPEPKQEITPDMYVTAENMIPPLAEELGRLLEPGIVRARAISKDPQVVQESNSLMWELKQWYAAREAAAAK